MTADQATAHVDLALVVGDRLPAAGTDWPTVDKTLAALLAGGSIREERGVRVTWPDGHTEDMWCDDRMASGQTLSEYRYQFHNSDKTSTSAQKIRRYVITTAATVVDDA